MRMVASVAALMLGATSPAAAAMIDATYQFSANFDSGPKTNIDGQISMRFDNATTSPAVVTSFSSSALQGYYTGAEFQRSDDGYMAVLFGNCVAGIQEYGCGLATARKEYIVGFEIDELGDVVGDVGTIEYTVGRGGEEFYQSTALVKRVKATSAVPEPATWAMMILGFGLVGYAMRRKTVLRYV